MRPAPSTRFDTLDLFRVVSVWGIVLLHVHLLSGGSYEDLVIRARDFAMPVLIMASFFVMAISFDRYPHRTAGEFFAGRVRRILVPSVIWSAIYWACWWMMRPMLQGGTPVLPPVSLVFTSYVHLWYLHFIFISAVVLAPLLIGVARGRLPRHPLAAAALALGVIIIFVVQPRLIEMTSAILYRSFDDVAYPAPDWDTCLSRVAPFLGYAPLGLAFALWRRQIGACLAHAWMGAVAVAAAVLMFTVHVALPGQPFTRPVFAAAVFLAILRPIPPHAFTRVRRMAEWTYVIYILHFGFAIVASAVMARFAVERTALTSLAASGGVFAVSFFAGVLLRRIPFVAPLLPLIPIAPTISTAGTWRAAAATALPPQPTL